MTDVKGRIVYTGNGTDEMSISTNSFESGVYLVQIQNDEFQTTVRVVKN